MPPTQAVPEGQTVPQPPQFMLSDEASMHRLVQRISPVGQLVLHAPLRQAVPGPQRWPQAPQLALSLARLVQTCPPLEPGQAASPAGQEIWQAPPLQA